MYIKINVDYLCLSSKDSKTTGPFPIKVTLIDEIRRMFIAYFFNLCTIGLFLFI